MRYFVWFGYDGAAYHGWQIQPNGNSVQEELQRGLSTLLREEISVTGAGRTDAGVHARVMVAHFDTEKALDCRQLAYKLNRLLPQDIAVDRVEQVSDDLHARFSATSRTYHYYIHTHKNPFARRYSQEMHYHLDFKLMNEAGRILCEYEDFGAFCKAGSDVKTTLCQVTHAQWHQISDTEWYFEITANRFLRNMVRALVGTLLEVGFGKLSVAEFQDIIDCKDRRAAKTSVPAQALFLTAVRYSQKEDLA